jgi:isopentenyl phosphate kinase
MVFRLLAGTLRPQRLLLLGIVEGVFERPPTNADPQPPLLREITPRNWDAVRAGLGGSHGTDVTGGMVAKVADTLALVQAVPGLGARIASGEEPGLLEQLLLNPALDVGTLLHT